MKNKQNKKGDIKALAEGFFADAPKFQNVLKEWHYEFYMEDGYIEKSAAYSLIKEKSPLDELKDELRRAFPINKPICLSLLYYDEASEVRGLIILALKEGKIHNYSMDFEDLGIECNYQVANSPVTMIYGNHKPICEILCEEIKSILYPNEKILKYNYYLI